MQEDQLQSRQQQQQHKKPHKNKNDLESGGARERAIPISLQGADTGWMQEKIDALFDENAKLRQEVMAVQSKTWTAGAEQREELGLQPWTKAQDRFAEDFLVKCSKRLVLEQESALYYRRRHYWLAVPALILGTIATGTAFSQWSNELLCEKASYVWLLVAFIFASATVMNGLTDHVFNFKARAARHHSVFKSFSGLIRELSQELSNPLHERKEYRKFMHGIVAQYNHFTDEAELIPRSVTKTVNKMLEEAEKQQYERELDRRHHRNAARYYPQNVLPPEYFTPWQKQWQKQRKKWTAQNSSETQGSSRTSSSTSPKTRTAAADATAADKASGERQASDAVRAMEEGRAFRSAFLSAKTTPAGPAAPVFDDARLNANKNETKYSNNNNRDSSPSSSSSRNRDFYAEVALPADTKIEIDMPKYDECGDDDEEEYFRDEEELKMAWLYMQEKQKQYDERQRRSRFDDTGSFYGTESRADQRDQSDEERFAHRRQSIIQLAPFTPRQRNFDSVHTDAYREEDETPGSVQMRAMARLLPTRGICEDIRSSETMRAARADTQQTRDGRNKGEQGTSSTTAAASRWQQLRDAMSKKKSQDKRSIGRQQHVSNHDAANEEEQAGEADVAIGKKGVRFDEKQIFAIASSKDGGEQKDALDARKRIEENDTPTPECVTKIARSDVDLSVTSVGGGGGGPVLSARSEGDREDSGESDFAQVDSRNADSQQRVNFQQRAKKASQRRRKKINNKKRAH